MNNKNNLVNLLLIKLFINFLIFLSKKTLNVNFFTINEIIKELINRKIFKTLGMIIENYDETILIIIFIFFVIFKMNFNIYI